jgi:hypothetical protein
MDCKYTIPQHWQEQNGEHPSSSSSPSQWFSSLVSAWEAQQLCEEDAFCTTTLTEQLSSVIDFIRPSMQGCMADQATKTLSSMAIAFFTAAKVHKIRADVKQPTHRTNN